MSLYIVATPIGNLEDITLRALRTLREADLVVAEDTRRTGRLLKHYEIKKPLLSYHDHNKIQKTPVIIERLEAGEEIALVSDSGTPGISDPGFYLVREAIESEISVIPIPGPTALISGLVVSGFPTDKFVFEGWLPRKSSQRKQRLEELSQELRTIIFFESLHRLLRSLADCLLVLGDRKAVLCRELTKKFETVRRDKISNLIKEYSDKSPKGEFVVIIEGYDTRITKNKI